jgi:hypothetical protein
MSAGLIGPLFIQPVSRNGKPTYGHLCLDWLTTKSRG